MDLVKIAKKVRKEYRDCEKEDTAISLAIKIKADEYKACEEDIENLQKRLRALEIEISPMLEARKKSLSLFREVAVKVSLLEEMLGQSLEDLK